MTQRLCLVGYGAIAGHHARILREEGATIDTVVGRVPEATAEFAAEHGVRYATTDIEAALSHGQFEAVVIASPNAVHYDQTRRSLLAGKHVLCEIPLAMSYAEGAELVEIARRQNRTLMVGHSQRFAPPLQYLRQKVAEGSLHVHHVSGRYFILRRENVGWTGRRRSWADSIVWHHGGHFVDFCLWLFGATDVDVQSNPGAPDPRTGVPMDLDVLLRTPANQFASLSLSYHSKLGYSEYVIIGEEETYHFAGGVLRDSSGVVMDATGPEDDELGPAWSIQDHEFLAALREGRAPQSSGADILPALAALQKIADAAGSAT